MTIFLFEQIIGEFGVVHSLTSSKSEFKKLGFSPNEIQRILAQREQKLMIPLITELSKLLRIPIRYTSLGSSLHNLFAGVSIFINSIIIKYCLKLLIFFINF